MTKKTYVWPTTALISPTLSNREDILERKRNVMNDVSHKLWAPINHPLTGLRAYCFRVRASLVRTLPCLGSGRFDMLSPASLPKLPDTHTHTPVENAQKWWPFLLFKKKKKLNVNIWSNRMQQTRLPCLGFVCCLKQHQPTRVELITVWRQY